MDLFDEDEVTTADQIQRPEDPYRDFNERNPLAGGGMLVQPGFGGTRQGYRESKPETITKISDFIEDFKLKKERPPSKNEIKVGLKIDSNTVVNAVEQGKLDILPEREAKILGQSKILEKRQELTVGKGKKPYVSVKERGKGGKEVLWESEAQKNQYINDLKKRFEGTGFRPQAYDAPTDYLTNKQLAIKYFGSDSPANVQRINNINTELRKTENLKYIEVGDDEKKGGKDRRLERERSGTALLSDREKRINLAQDEYVQSLNDFFKQNPNKIKNYPKLIELINLSFDPKTGTIGSKNKTLDELKKYITSQGGLFDIEHISDLQYEKKNRQFPVNRQIAPQNVNKGFLSSVTAYIKNNKDNPEAQTQIKNIENTLKKYGLRVYVPDTGTFGAKMIGAYDQANNSFPNFDRIINNLDVKSPNFKFKEIPTGSSQTGEITKKQEANFLSKMGFKCKYAKADGGRIGLSTGSGKSKIRCDDPASYTDDVNKTRQDLKSTDVRVRAAAKAKLDKGLQVAKTLPKIGTFLRRAGQATVGAVTSSLKALGFTAPVGYAIEGMVEGGIYDYFKKQGYTHDQALAETFTPGLVSGRPEGVPWYGGAETLLEKELIGATGLDEEGKTIATPENISGKVAQYVSALKDQDQVYDAFGRLEQGQQASRKDIIEKAQADIRDLTKTGTIDNINKLINVDTKFDANTAKQAYEEAVEAQAAKQAARGKAYRDQYYVNQDTTQDFDDKLLKKRNKEMLQMFPPPTVEDVQNVYKQYGVEDLLKNFTAQDYKDEIKNFDDFQKKSYFADNFRLEKAGGGIAKIAGVDQGPPPESGPNSQGLQGLMKRVRNL